MANVPLIHQVIPIIDYLLAHLEKVIDDLDMHPAICHVAQNGMSVLDTYYAHTDESDMYWMAMSTHVLQMSLFITNVTNQSCTLGTSSAILLRRNGHKHGLTQLSELHGTSGKNAISLG